MKASQLVAEFFSEHRPEASEALHPRFVATMQNVRLSGNEFITASRGDHAPLTDLRLRRDDSSRQMLLLNVRALGEASPSSLRDLQHAVLHSDVIDGPGRDVLSLGAAPSGTDSVPTSGRPAPASTAAYESLLKYVNAFGSWDEAQAVAFAYADDDALPAGRLRGLTSGLVGVVLGLSGETVTCDRQFEDSVKSLSDSPEQFFVYLRWASLTAKRRGDLARADVLLERATQSAEEFVAADRHVVAGLTSNLRALFALRRGDATASRRLVDEAIEHLRAAHSTATARSIGDAETARYLWMAELNRVQLDLSQQNYVAAIERLHVLREFSRRHDEGALHTTLSTLAYIHLVRGDAVTAAPLLREVLDLLRDEYDPAVVLQVRKMLYRAYVELGDKSRAERVSRMSPYFWLVDEEELHHEH